jgi:hypothetical protein
MTKPYIHIDWACTQTMDGLSKWTPSRRRLSYNAKWDVEYGTPWFRRIGFAPRLRGCIAYRNDTLKQSYRVTLTKKL